MLWLVSYNDTLDFELGVELALNFVVEYFIVLKGPSAVLLFYLAVLST